MSLKLFWKGENNIIFLHTYVTWAEYAIRSSRRDTGVVGGPAVTRRSGPTSVTDALSAFASTMIGAELTLIAVAGEVIALAKMSRYYLQEWVCDLANV